jgi:flagellar biosynthesis regulator FlaF
MQGVFRKRCDDLVNAYVCASLKREYDAREICLFMEERMRRDRRQLRKRIATLEREKKVSDRSIEDLAWEVEQLNFKLKSMGMCLTHEVKLRLGAIESRLNEVKTHEVGCCNETAVFQQPQPVDELGWTQI